MAFYEDDWAVVVVYDICLEPFIGAICRDLRSRSINIHNKREKNPSGKPEGAPPPRVFHSDFSLVLSEYYVFC